MSRTKGVILSLIAVVCLVSGCKSDSSNKPPTPDQAKYFKGAPPTADDRAGMVKEEQSAAAYRKAHPEQFPTETATTPR